MRTITTTATITEDGVLMVPAPPDIPAGQHRVVVVIEEQIAQANGSEQGGSRRSPLELTPHATGLLDDGFTFRREELYNDG